MFEDDGVTVRPKKELFGLNCYFMVLSSSMKGESLGKNGRETGSGACLPHNHLHVLHINSTGYNTSVVEYGLH